jgi:2-keto-3-deoxy-6-phosphogluconate aldolase
VFETYRAIHEQGFIPIFVQGRRDPKLLVEACLQAGIKCIEYTMREPRAADVIPWIRANYPGLHLLVGSTLGSDPVVRQARRMHPQIRTLREFADMGVDGFVSMTGWSTDVIRHWAATHVVIPCAMTLREAFIQLDAGAQFIKVLGPHLDLVRLCRSEATFGACPIFLTGGITLARVPGAVEAGVVVLGSGFDLMLAGQPENIGIAEIADILRAHVRAVQAAREAKWPAMACASGMNDVTWLQSLPHVTPWCEE